MSNRIGLTPETVAAAHAARELGCVSRTEGVISMAVSDCVENEHFDTIAELSRRQHEALGNYGTHDRDCLLSQCHSGRPMEDGSYETLFGDQWYRKSEWPPCSCGFDAVLALWPDDPPTVAP